jgi:3-oxoacyl-[acyl-carrier-protein] synthase II
VVVTGIGLTTSLGSDRSSFWERLSRGRSAVTWVQDTDGAREAGRDGLLAAPVADFSPDRRLDQKSRRLMTRAVMFAVAAADAAVQDAGISTPASDPGRVGLFIGSPGQGTSAEELLPAIQKASDQGGFDLGRFGAEGISHIVPTWLLKGLPNSGMYYLSLRTNATGMNNNVSLGGVGATVAIGEAFESIRRGCIDVAIAGGYDSMLDAGRTAMYLASGMVTSARAVESYRGPFDRGRDGFVLGEGAGFLVLQSSDSALASNVRVYCEVLGYACATAPGPVSRMGPSEAGFTRALGSALESARIKRPDAVFAHGLGTKASDVAEARALEALFGHHARAIPVPSLKGTTGHTFAASGGIEAAAAILSLGYGSIPPTTHLRESDPACDLDYVPGSESRPARLESVLLSNANLAGAHAALVFGRHQ